MGGSGLVMGVGWVWGAAAEAAGGRVGCFGVSGTGIELLLVLDCGILVWLLSFGCPQHHHPLEYANLLLFQICLDLPVFSIYLSGFSGRLFHLVP